jgi:hypothetical protein
MAPEEQKVSNVSRRGFLHRAAAVSLGSIAARGVYEVLDEVAGGPPRAEAAVVRRLQEQYLVERIEVILNNGVTVAIPPLYNDVFTAKLRSGSWSGSQLKSAKTRVEKALAAVEKPYSATAAGLTMVIGWGLPYFRTFVPSLMDSYLPAIPGPGLKKYAVLDAIQFPSDPDSVVLEQNHVMFKFRSDDPNIVAGAERALFEEQNSGAYIGDLFQLTSKRIGFLGRGFGTPTIGKDLAVRAGVAGADKIPADAQLFMGFTSTQTQALGPDNIPSFETIPGVTDQWPNGYFAAGCAMHLSHLYLDLDTWYNSTRTQAYAERVKRMFSPRAPVPTDPNTVTIPNGPGQISTWDKVLEDAASGVLGHNALLQQAARLGADVKDNYGRLRPKGTSVPLREDFNTLDDPFFWYRDSDGFIHQPAPNQPGMHFVAFLPGHHLFHRARMAMDGIVVRSNPDGTTTTTNFREPPYNISDENNGINARMRASHRQNYVIPPRRNRSFPLVELLT